jgi:hypothetical protein
MRHHKVLATNFLTVAYRVWGLVSSPRPRSRFRYRVEAVLRRAYPLRGPGGASASSATSTAPEASLKEWWAWSATSFMLWVSVRSGTAGLVASSQG